MSAESEINALLNAYAPLTDVVDTRIYPDFIAQEIQPPAVVFQRNETSYVTTIHDAQVHGTLVTMDVWCLETTRIGAEELGDLVEGALAAATSGDTVVLPIGRRPEYEPESDRYAAIVTCNLWPQ